MRRDRATHLADDLDNSVIHNLSDFDGEDNGDTIRPRHDIHGFIGTVGHFQRCSLAALAQVHQSAVTRKENSAKYEENEIG